MVTPGRGAPGYGRRRRDDDPAPARPAALEPLALARGHRPRHHVDPRRVRGDDRRGDREHPDRQGRARSLHPAIGLGGHLLPARRDRRRARLRLPHGSLRAQEPVHGHARRLPRVHRRLGLGVELLELRRLPVPRRRRHRRRVRGDQLRDRRADPGPRSRSGRARDQRQLVGRHSRRLRSSPTCCSTAWTSRSGGGSASSSARPSPSASSSSAASSPRARAGC